MSLQQSVYSHALPSYRFSRVDLAYLAHKWRKGEPLSALVLSDALGARLAEESQAEIVVAAFSDGGPRHLPTEKTASLSDTVAAIEEIREHNRFSFVVGDIPLCAYSEKTRLIEAAQILMEAGADAVKIEGGKELAPLVREITGAGIPVVGHIGYTPKTGAPMRRRGSTPQDFRLLQEDAIALREAGIKALVLELVRSDAAAFLTRNIPLPTIGIYSGGGTSGQVLVLNDILGITHFDPVAFPKGKPKSIGDWSGTPSERVLQYVKKVKTGQFPAPVGSLI